MIAFRRAPAVALISLVVSGVSCGGSDPAPTPVPTVPRGSPAAGLITVQKDSLLPGDSLSLAGTYIMDLEERTLWRFGGDLSWSPDSQDVLIICCEGTGRDLFRYSLASGEVEMLHDGDPSSAAWSPDGARIAFVDQGTDSGVFIIGARDDLAPTKVVDVRGDLNLSWSPDGRFLAAANNLAVHVVEAASLSRSVIFEIEGRARFPAALAWSPDGSRLASCAVFAGREGAPDSPHLNIYEVASESALRFADAGCSDPQWTADGMRIIVGGEGGIFIVNAVTVGAASPLPDAAFHAVSPNRPSVAYVTDDCAAADEPAADLMLSSMDGGPPSRIEAAGEVAPSRPVWTSDGESLILAATSADGTRELQQINIRTGRVDRIAASEKPLELRGLSPDGRYLAFVVKNFVAPC